MSVFDRLVAIDDFPTFKKLMVKRNVELQLEALQAFRQKKRRDDLSSRGEAADREEGKESLLTDAYLEMGLLQRQVRGPPLTPLTSAGTVGARRPRAGDGAFSGDGGRRGEVL